MKRIDQKVQEIEKKDRQNRLLFIGFVILILAFMAIVLYYQDQIAKKDQALTEEQIKSSKLYTDLDEKKNEIEKQKNELEASLRPEDYWNYIKDENSVQGYIDYITNIWGIKRDSIDEAIQKLKALPKNNISVNSGWLYSGLDTNNDPYQSAGEIEVVWRSGSIEDDNIKDTLPQINDVVQFVGSINRKTYSNKSLSGSGNPSGWRPNMKGLVTDIYKDGSEIKIEIKYN
ncbi:hypothetical protein U0L90_11650 [Flavobacteriaceae sp. LMIT009]